MIPRKASRFRRKSPDRNRRRLSVEQLEARRVLATLVWDGGGDGSSWHDAGNWDNTSDPSAPDSIPTAVDDVTISGSVQVQVAGSAVEANSLSLLTQARLTTVDSLPITIGTDLNVNTGRIVGGDWSVGGTTTISGYWSELHDADFSGETLNFLGASSQLNVYGSTRFDTLQMDPRTTLRFADGYVLHDRITTLPAAGFAQDSFIHSFNPISASVPASWIIESGAVIETNAGSPTQLVVGSINNNLENRGMLRAEGAKLTVEPNSFTNNGILQVDSSELVAGSRNSFISGIPGEWTAGDGSGSIVVNGGTFATEGDGAMTLGSLNLPNFQRIGGEVELRNTLDLAGETLTLDDSTGSWRLNGAIIVGGSGTIVTDATNGITFGLSVNELRDVTLPQELDVFGGAEVRISGDTTFPQLNLGTASRVNFAVNSTIQGDIYSAGTGFSEASIGTFRPDFFTNGDLTIAPGVTVGTTSAGSPPLLVQNGFGSLINDGTLLATGGAGQLRTIGLTNNASVLSTGANARVTHQSLVINNGTFESRDQGIVALGNDPENVFEDEGERFLDGGTWIARAGGQIEFPPNTAGFNNLNASVRLDGVSSQFYASQNFGGPINVLEPLTRLDGSGELRLEGDALLNVDGDSGIRNRGTISIADGASLVLDGGSRFWNEGGVSIASGGTLNAVQGMLNSGLLGDLTVGGLLQSGTDSGDSFEQLSSTPVRVSGTLEAVGGSNIVIGGVDGGAEVLGTGTLKGPVEVLFDGTLTPATNGTVGTLTIDGDLNIQGSVQFDIESTELGPRYDQLVVTGDTDFSTASLSTSYTGPGDDLLHEYVLIDHTAGSASGDFAGEFADFEVNGELYLPSFEGGADQRDFVLYEPFVVFNTRDSGPGTLRQSLLDIDLLKDSVGIFEAQFELAGNGPHTIALETPLEQITSAITLDGAGQAGFVDEPIVILDGSNIPAPGDGEPGVDGLSFFFEDSDVFDDVVVRNLGFQGFSGHGISVETGPGVAQDIWIPIEYNRFENNTGGSIKTDASHVQISISQARLDGLVLGTLASGTPFTTYRIDFYTADAPGEAQNYVGETLITTDEKGEIEFEIGGLGNLPEGKYLTAVAFGDGGETAGSEPGETLIGSPRTSSEFALGVIPQIAIIRGLPTRGPEGRPIVARAFGVPSVGLFEITGYEWSVLKDDEPYAAANEAGIKFEPDDEGVYTVELRITESDGTTTRTRILQPPPILIHNVAPTPQFEISKNPAAIGETITFTSFSSDPGLLDELTYAWEIREGRPGGPVLFTKPASEEISAQYTTTAGGQYYVSLTVDDQDTGVRTLTRPFEVEGLPSAVQLVAPDSGSEGRSIRVRVPTSELRRAELFSYAWTVEKVTDGTPTAYASTQPALGVVEFTPDDNAEYHVKLTMTETSTGTSIESDTASILVTNASPIVEVKGADPVETINEAISFTAEVTDPGTADTHKFDWQVELDGRIISSASINDGPATFDFTPDKIGVYTVQAIAKDDDYNAGTGVGIARNVQRFIVESTVDSSGWQIDATAGPYSEGSNVTFIVNGLAASEVSAYKWRAIDRRGREFEESSPFESFDFTPPVQGDYLIELELVFPDASRHVLRYDLPVGGLAPVIETLSVTSPAGQIDEGALVTVEANATDAGNHAGFTYAWEVRQPGGGWLAATGRESAPNVLDVVAIDHGTIDFRVTVTDTFGNFSKEVLSRTVNNVNPEVRISDLQENVAGNFVFTALATDVPADTSQLMYSWSTDGGNTFTSPTASGESPEYAAVPTQITVKVTDDSGQTLVSAYVVAGDASDNSITIDASTADAAQNANASRIFVAGLGGNDDITVTSSTATDGTDFPVTVLGGAGDDDIDTSAVNVNVILDGGAGDDDITAGGGDDLLIAGPGTNTLSGGDGDNVYYGGGDDTFIGGNDNDDFRVHFSTVAITDNGGGHDIVNLAAAPAGVTLDFGLVDGTAQDVFTGSTLALTGTFTELIGSPQADIITSNLDDKIIRTGDGNDSVSVGGAGAEVFGGDGNDTISLVASSGSISGGAGVDNISGSVAFGQTLELTGGEGDDVIDITGAAGGARPTVHITGGAGNNSIKARNVTGKIFADTGDIAATSIFGSALGHATIEVENSSDLDIFGSATGISELTISDQSSDIDIFSRGDTVNLVGVTEGRIHTQVFGSATGAEKLTVDIADLSSDIDIFGSAFPDDELDLTLENTSDIDIFGSALNNEIEIIASEDIGIFGVSDGAINFKPNAGGNGLDGGQVVLSQFQANPAAAVSITIDGANQLPGSDSRLQIFGTASPHGAEMNLVAENSSDLDIFGSARGNETIEIIASEDIGIYGVRDGSIRFGPEDPNDTTLGVTGAIIRTGVFGSAVNRPLDITINNSEDIGIFGTASELGEILDVTSNNSSDLDIFGSARGGEIEVLNSSDIDIYGQASTKVTLQKVTEAQITTNIFGTAQPNSALEIEISDQSSDIGIFGSARRNMDIEVLNSSDIDIYGGMMVNEPYGFPIVTGDIVKLNNVMAATIASGVFGTANPQESDPIMDLTVNNSSDLDIFGSARGIVDMEIEASEDIGIFAGLGDKISLTDVKRTSVEGGVFGSWNPFTGLDVAIDGNSEDIGIFGSELRDHAIVRNGTRIGLDLREGDDWSSITGGSEVVVLGDAGQDSINISGGSNVLAYLGDGNDSAEISGGTDVIVLGAEGDDRLQNLGGTNVEIDGGAGGDTLFFNGSQANAVGRADAGDDKIFVVQSPGVIAGGGAGNDTLRFLGGFSTDGIDVTSFQGVLDGQSGDDVLSVEPTSDVWDYAWQFGTSNFEVDGSPRSRSPFGIALVGGKGNDDLTASVEQRAALLGGDGDDQLKLLSGNNSSLAGGDGNDTVLISSTGVGNYAYGDEGNDEFTVEGGLLGAIYLEQGDDTIEFRANADTGETAKQTYVRAGSGEDSLSVAAGQGVVVAGDHGRDNVTVTGGIEIVGSGGLDNDDLQVTGGVDVLLLGEGGHDELTLDGGQDVILSGGDGNDSLIANRRDGALYGDDGDDDYQLRPISDPADNTPLIVRELIYTEDSKFDLDARGADTINLSAFSVPANLNLRNQTSSAPVIPDQVRLDLQGTFENIVGTSADDILIGNDEPNRIDGGPGNDAISSFGGNDTLIGGLGNDSLDGGSGNDVYEFSSTAGDNLGTDLITEATGDGEDTLDFRELHVGISGLDLGVASIQELHSGVLSLQLAQPTPGTEPGEVENVLGSDFDDSVIGTSIANRFDLGGGNDQVDGRGGGDVFVFGGRNLGSDMILDDPAGVGTGTLDFSAFDAPLDLDLSSTSPQPQAGELILQLGSPTAIQNVIGSSYADIITGNSLDNHLFGSGSTDELWGGDGNNTIHEALPVVVFLDFDSAFNDARGDFDYSPDQRMQIKSDLESVFAEFDWTFTLSLAEAQTLTANSGRAYVTLAFNQGRGGGIAGDAGEVDFRNIRRHVTTEVNINALMNSLRDLVPPTGGESPEDYKVRFEAAVVRMTSHIAAHELGHSAGLRHGDAFGPIGSGLSPDTDLSGMYPEYEGPVGAHETKYHIIASPASVGSTLSDVLELETFFGARETIKLAFNEFGETRREQSTGLDSHNTIATAEPLGPLEPLFVPNLAKQTGLTFFEKDFRVRALSVTGDLQQQGTAEASESDYYRFEAFAGDIVNIEMLANSMRPLRGDPIDSAIRVFNAAGEVIAENDDDFEGTKDATLYDVAVDATGQYFIEVGLSVQPAIANFGGRYELFVSRFRSEDAGSGPAISFDSIITADQTPQLSGTIDDITARVNVLIGGEEYPVRNDGIGGWQLPNDIVAPLPSGIHPVIVTATDSAGNETVLDSSTVHVVLHAPTGVTVQEKGVAENTDTSAADLLFAELAAVDQDSGDQFTYELVDSSDPADTSDDDNAKIVVSGNQVFLKQNQPLDYETQPTYSIRVRVTDAIGNSTEQSVVLNVVNVPEFVPGTGGGPDGLVGVGLSMPSPTPEQRSIVDTLTVQFDGPVEIASGAFKVFNRDDRDNPVTVGWTPDSSVTGKFISSFSGNHTRTPHGFLQDGNYELHIDGSKITAVGHPDVQLDADGDGQPGGIYVFGDEAADLFFAFFGDIDGDRAISGQDYGWFGSAFRKRYGQDGYNIAFDYFANNAVDGQDYGFFGTNFRRRRLTY